MATERLCDSNVVIDENSNMEEMEANNDPLKKLREHEEFDKTANLLRPYCRFLVRWPIIMVALVLFAFVFSIVLSIVPALGSKDFPDFSKPTKGFEPRGTTLSERSVAFQNLDKFPQLGYTNNPGNESTTLRRKRRATTRDTEFYYDLSKFVTTFFWVYKRADNGNLLNVKNMKDVCQLHKDYVESHNRYSYWFWGLHHVPNYIAILAGKSDCSNITQPDVDSFKVLLQKCVGYYKNSSLSNCLQDATKCSAIHATECREDARLTLPYYNQGDIVRLVYNVFQFLTDKTFADNPAFMKITGSSDMVNTYMNFETDLFKPFYENHLNDLTKVKVGDVQVVAFEMLDLKFTLFQTEIIVQSLFIIFAIVIVILFIWFFSGSLFIGLMTLACIIIALVISYFVYGRVFNMAFFPFLNMVTLIFIVGIGADDAFVYTGIWSEALKIYGDVANFEERLIKCTIHAIRHGLVAMFVTSLTTAAAFYANVTSVVTSVKCFGLFSGTAIIVNYLLMVTFFPVVVILHEKVFGPCMHKCSPTACKDTKNINDDNKPAPSKVHQFLDKLSHNVFEVYLPKIILKGKFAWIIVLLLIGIGGCVVTFAEPGLNPPSSGDFQMFVDSNPLEQYGLEYKKQFAFGSGSEGYNRNIFFVFGVEPEDNGYKFNPDDLGTLKFSSIEHLDLGNSQAWIRQFCQNLGDASFIKESQSCKNLELLFKSIESPCVFGQKAGCCNTTIPMDSKDFMKCFRGNVRNNLPSEPDKTKPIFDQRGNLKALVLVAETRYVYTDEFKYNKDASDTVESWFGQQTRNSTSDTFKNGWWYIFNTFYDLQLGLFEGTKQSLGIAIAVAFVVILLTTFNILLSLYSILTITFIISVTVGILVLSGWKLNVLESIVFSVAAGLSTDFTLHYSVAYQTSLLRSNRVDRVRGALSHIGPAILMGAVTTFIAGLVMTPSQVLVYIQMAQFLMLVMFISWLYSTLFFMPLCSFIGPTGSMGQLTCKKVKKAKHSVSGAGSSLKRRVSHPHEPHDSEMQQVS